MSIYCPLAEALGIETSISILDLNEEGGVTWFGIPGSFAGKKHLEESKRRIGLSNSIAQKGVPKAPRTEQHKRNNGDSRARKWLVTHPDGSKEKIHNMAKFCREHGLDKRSLHHTIHGKRGKYHKGYSVERII